MKFHPNHVFNDRIFRPITADGDDFKFLVVDVAHGLGFKNSTEAMRYIDRSNLDTVDMRVVQYVDGTPASQQIAGQPTRWVTNLAGLFQVALCGASPHSKEFQDWISSTMLPRLYRYGHITLDELNEKIAEVRSEYGAN